MWYFAWILGTAFACSLAVFNALWFELENDFQDEQRINPSRTNQR